MKKYLWTLFAMVSISLLAVLLYIQKEKQYDDKVLEAALSIGFLNVSYNDVIFSYADGSLNKEEYITFAKRDEQVMEIVASSDVDGSRINLTNYIINYVLLLIGFLAAIRVIYVVCLQCRLIIYMYFAFIFLLALVIGIATHVIEMWYFCLLSSIVSLIVSITIYYFISKKTET